MDPEIDTKRDLELDKEMGPEQKQYQEQETPIQIQI
jgi:hypothetical protein